jgi:hypothetical protein
MKKIREISRIEKEKDLRSTDANEPDWSECGGVHALTP